MRFKLSLILNAIYPTIFYLAGILPVIIAIFAPTTADVQNNIIFNNLDIIVIFTLIISLLLMFINVFFVTNNSINDYSEIWNTPNDVIKIVSIITLIAIIISTFKFGIIMLATLFLLLACVYMIKNINILIKSIKFPLNYEEEILDKNRDEMKESLLAKYPKVKRHILNY